MGLILKNELLTSIGTGYNLASNMGIIVDKKVLSAPYELITGNIINAEIMYVIDFKNDKEIKGLEKEKIRLVLISTSFKDYLMIHKEDWPKLRDYGILADEILISLNIDEVLKGTSSIKVYPKGNVEVNGR